MWIYILKIRDENPFNDYHKIGISGDIPNRVEYIKRSLKESGLRSEVKVRFRAYIIGAYFLEQSLHRLLKRKRRKMPVTVSGYTEFFDLNFINIIPVILIIQITEFIQFMGVLYLLSLIINSI